MKLGLEHIYHCEIEILKKYNDKRIINNYYKNLKKSKNDNENIVKKLSISKYSPFENACISCQNYIRESDVMSVKNTLEAYHQAKFGDEKAKNIYMNKINEYINNVLKVKVEFPNVYDNLQDAIYHEAYGMGKIYFWLNKEDHKMLRIENLPQMDRKYIKEQVEKNIKSTDLSITATGEVWVKYDTEQKVIKLFKLDQKTIDRITNTLITHDGNANYREKYHELYTKNNNRVTLTKLNDGKKDIEIRRFVIQDFSLHFLSSQFKSFPRQLIPVLESLVKLNTNILLAGGTGSGKSTLMNCFLKVKDLQKNNGSGILIQKDPEIEINKIMKNSKCKEIILKEQGTEKIESKLLRSSADYFIFTEMKEKEMIEIFLKIIGRGSEGNMVTYHSSEAEQLIDSIAGEFPEKYKQVERKLANNLDIIMLIQKVKVSDSEKRKMITKIVIPYMEGNQIKYKTIYEYQNSTKTSRFYKLENHINMNKIKNRDFKEYQKLENMLQQNSQLEEINF